MADAGIVFVQTTGYSKKSDRFTPFYSCVWQTVTEAGGPTVFSVS
jgi:hypothetical protein